MKTLKNTSLIIIILALFSKKIESSTDEQKIELFKQTRKVEQIKNTKIELQCITLKNFLTSLPEETEIVYEVPSTLKRFFLNKNVKLQSFESFLLSILSKLFINETIKDISDYDVFKMLNEKLKKVVSENKRIEKTILKQSDTDYNQFLSLKLLLNQIINELKVKLNFKSSPNKISEKITENNKKMQNLIKILQITYKKLKEKIITFMTEKENLKKKIENLKKPFEFSKIYKEIQKFKEDLINKKYPNPDINEENEFTDDLENKEIISEEILWKKEINTFFNKGMELGIDYRKDNLKESIDIAKKTFLKLKIMKKKINSNIYINAFENLLGENLNEIPQFLMLKSLTFKYDKYLKEFKEKMDFIVGKMKNFLTNTHSYKRLVETDSIKFLNKNYGKFLDNIKNIKNYIIKIEEDIKEKLEELIILNQQIEILNYKKNTSYDFIFDNNLLLDLEIEVEAGKKDINYFIFETNKEINNKIISSYNAIQKEKNEKNKMLLRIEFQNNLKKERLNKLQNLITLLTIRNDIQEIFSMKMGRILGRLQNMPKNKKCFSLPTVSLHIFKMIKTNIIHFEKIFLENFLQEFPNFEKKKKFIFYNYMISENKRYGIEIINKLDNYKISEKDFIENFTTNFSLFLTIIKNKTVFANNEIKKLTGSEIAKNIFNMLNIDWTKVGKNDINAEKLFWKVIFKKMNIIILAILPFLNVIPFMNLILRKIEFAIYFSIKTLIRKIYRGVCGIKKKFLNRISVDKMDLDFEQFIDLPEFLEDSPTDDKFELNMSLLKNIEKLYKKQASGNNFDFEAFDSSNNFYYKNGIDIYRLEDKEYLKSIDILEFDISPINVLI